MRHGKDMNLAEYAVASDSIFLGDNKHNMTTWTLNADPSKNTKGDSINAAHEYGIKNAVFALRLVDDKPACDFLIESVGDKPIPTDGKGGWIKIQNGVPVIAKLSLILKSSTSNRLTKWQQMLRLLKYQLSV